MQANCHGQKSFCCYKNRCNCLARSNLHISQTQLTLRVRPIQVKLYKKLQGRLNFHQSNLTLSPSSIYRQAIATLIKWRGSKWQVQLSLTGGLGGAVSSPSRIRGIASKVRGLWVALELKYELKQFWNTTVKQSPLPPLQNSIKQILPSV